MEFDRNDFIRFAQSYTRTCLSKLRTKKNDQNENYKKDSISFKQIDTGFYKESINTLR